MCQMQILLVDDKPGLIGSVIEQIFTDAQLTIVSDPTKALSVFSSMKDRLDVVLLDICMDDLDGRNLCEQMREQAQLYVPIVFITGSSSIEVQFDALRTSADTLWEKGMLMNQPGQFRRSVRKLVELYELKKKYLRLAGKAEEADQLADECRTAMNSAMVRLQYARATIETSGLEERINKLASTLQEIIENDNMENKTGLILTYIRAIGKEVGKSFGNVGENLAEVESFLTKIRLQLDDQSERADQLREMSQEA